jgi:hypothetical protein
MHSDACGRLARDSARVARVVGFARLDVRMEARPGALHDLVDLAPPALLVGDRRIGIRGTPGAREHALLAGRREFRIVLRRHLHPHDHFARQRRPGLHAQPAVAGPVGLLGEDQRVGLVEKFRVEEVAQSDHAPRRDEIAHPVRVALVEVLLSDEFEHVVWRPALLNDRRREDALIGTHSGDAPGLDLDRAHPGAIYDAPAVLFDGVGVDLGQPADPAAAGVEPAVLQHDFLERADRLGRGQHVRRHHEDAVGERVQIHPHRRRRALLLEPLREADLVELRRLRGRQQRHLRQHLDRLGQLVFCDPEQAQDLRSVRVGIVRQRTSPAASK